MTPAPDGSAPSQTRTLPLHDAIAEQARKLWERYGRPEGRDDEIWLEAERQVLGVDPRVTQLPDGAVASRPLQRATHPERPAPPPPSPAVPPAATSSGSGVRPAPRADSPNPAATQGNSR